jgi:hypothetical protein
VGRTPAEGTAGTGGVYPVAKAPFAGHVGAVSVVPDALITGVASNYKTIALQNRGQAGSGTTVMASRACSSGNNAPQADETALALSGTATDYDFAEGDILAIVTTVTGTGMTLPGMAVMLDLVRD